LAYYPKTPPNTSKSKKLENILTGINKEGRCNVHVQIVGDCMLPGVLSGWVFLYSSVD
jgi:hypothetical protein